MRITKSEEYGLRLVLRLAAEGGQRTIRELAALEGLPETTVAKVVSKLRRAGLVNAERGRNGGYSLTTAAREITVGQVVGAFDSTVYGPDFCARMTPGKERCANEADCGLRPVWHGLTAVIGDFLSNITIADIVGGTTGGRDGLPMVTGQQHRPNEFILERR